MEGVLYKGVLSKGALSKGVLSRIHCREPYYIVRLS